jgi:alpha-tubulin suppressor-like RCC1 family protein
VIDSGTTYKQVTPSYLSTCGITTAGVLKCWGLGGNGTLGDGTTNSRSSPVVIDAGTSYSSIFSIFVSCGITTAGVLKCWGVNNNGAVGDGTLVTRLSPHVVDSGVTFKSVQNTSASGCGMTTSNTLRCWGVNHRGQAGDGSDDLLSSSPRNITKWLTP